MVLRPLRMVFILVFAMLSMSAMAQISVTEAFGSLNYTVSGPDSPYIYGTGDFIQDSWITPGFNSVSEASLNLTYDSNTLGETLYMGVVLNGSTVGYFVINPGDTVTVVPTFDFTPVAAVGGGYTVQLMAVYGVDPGYGQVGLLADGVTSKITLVSTPEPGTFALLAGVSVCGLTVRRRKLATKH